jgi:hypothetical protein
MASGEAKANKHCSSSRTQKTDYVNKKLNLDFIAPELISML